MERSDLSTSQKKENVLVLTAEFPPVIGGLAAYSFGICNGFISNGIKVVALAPLCGKITSGYNQNGLKVFRYPNIFVLREILLIPFLIYLVIRFRISRILCISWCPCGLVAMFNKFLLGIPYAVMVFGSDIIKKDVSKSKLRHGLKRKFFWLMKLVFRNAKNIFPISNFTMQILLDVGVSQEKIKVINPGVNIQKYSSAVDTRFVVERYNLKGKEVILTAARLEDYKGQDMVISSLKEVIKKVPNIAYLIVGDGPDKKRLKDITVSSGLERYVVFVDNTLPDELVKFYAASSIFVMVSREMERRVEVEGFGIVFLEANACGKPVIGGNSGGISDAIIDGQTGLIVDPLDVGAISNAILRLLLDKEYAAYLGRMGIERVRENFSWELVARRAWDLMRGI